MDPVITKAVSEAVVATGSAGGTGGEKVKPAGVSGAAGESEFNKLMEAQRNEHLEANRLAQELFGMPAGGGNALKVLPAESFAIDPSRTSVGRKTDIVHILSEVNRSSLQMDQMIEMISTGQSMTPRELLAVQAGVFQIVQEIELTGQVVSSADRARNSLWNMQV